MTSHLVVASKTDTGKRRSENQDAVLVHDVQTPEGVVHLLAVADGVGGGPGGQLASEQTLRSLTESVMGAETQDPPEALHDGVLLANATVKSIADQKPELAGMASTLTAALVRDGRVWLANVGDSRVYLIRERNAWPLTYDHSWVAEQVEAGKMTPQQAAADPRRNMITRAVGSDPRMAPDVYEPLALENGDILLLCSDGLYGVVGDSELADMCSDLGPEEAVEKLVDLANERGGPDNISVVVARWDAGDS
ncbi:MAG TPA: protein phosphatase 2C domain-containing protein [Dehalococcoidia bacterium]|nr:protein phosphatase 2C domain-containing protein [Dehalococcoidia bacterium]